MPEVISNNEHGFTLLEAMVTISIMGIVAMTSTSLLNNQLRAIDHMEKRVEILEIKSSIRQKVDCKATLKNVCKYGDHMLYSLKNNLKFSGVTYQKPFQKEKDDAHLYELDFAGEVTSKPEWVLKVKCKNNTVFVDYARKKGDRYIQDKLTRKLMHFKPLFENGLCTPAYDHIVQCPRGKKVSKVNFNTGQVHCAK